MLKIRQTVTSDEQAIHQVHEAAFGGEAGYVIAGLTLELLHDPTAAPLLSLLAWDGADAVGHVIFTCVRIDGAACSPVAHILAPLAVLPGRQREGIGTQIVQSGLDMLKDMGSELVFVLGHPEYYPRFGFRPAGVLGLSAPYPILEKNADAWMVLALREGVIGNVRGTVRCAHSLDKEEYWVE